MPEYLAPGVYVEETSFRAKSIEGVSTSTAGFIGPARFGPHLGEPELLTSFAAFERIYGGLDRLNYGGELQHNYLAQAVRAFFEEGGRRLYVIRALASDAVAANATTGPATSPPTAVGSPATGFTRWEARFAGVAGNVVLKHTFRLGQNTLGVDERGRPMLRGVSDHDVVVIRDTGSPDTLEGRICRLERFHNITIDRDDYRLHAAEESSPAGTMTVVDSLDPTVHRVQVLTVTLDMRPLGESMSPMAWTDLALHPEHANSLSRVFESDSNRLARSTALYVPLMFTTDLTNGAQIAELLVGQRPADETGDYTSPAVQYQSILDALLDGSSSDANRSFSVELENGTDGTRPDAEAYAGDEDSSGLKSGLQAFEDIEDISIVAAPGSTFDYRGSYRTNAQTILRHLISHCERMRYRIAVLDSAEGHLVSEVREYRAQLDSKYAALYYPWIRVLDPITRKEIHLPPSGYVAGIYARNDIEHGVHKAPANEVVRSALGFEFLLNKGQQDVLNPEGINAFRFFEGRGFRLWGARTVTSDPEWKYVNLRRYFAYLERSIDKGTQWAVFENNSEPLWANIRTTIEDFLYNEWKNDRMMGETPKEAYFVRCDRSTMTQNDIDNGRLICLIGIAPVRPAEFVIFRIGQWTATRRG